MRLIVFTRSRSSTTPTGQAFVRRDQTGSVIDHISLEHVNAVAIPFINGVVRLAATDQVRQAIVLREEARLTLADAAQEMTSALPQVSRPKQTGATWEIYSFGLEHPSRCCLLRPGCCSDPKEPAGSGRAAAR